MVTDSILKNENGMSTLLAAGLMFLLVGIVGLVIDIGYMYVAKGQLQHAADAGALAGAAILKPSDPSTIPLAKQAARQFAECNNVADCRPFTNGVALDISKNEMIDAKNGNDITVGYWDGTTYSDGPTYITSPPTPTMPNAIKVRARRTANSPLNQVNIFFSKLFGWDKMSAAAEAIADLKPADIVPIVVNEYWLEKDNESGGRPYPDPIHTYPNSFVRKRNVDGNISTAWGKIFAILGDEAETTMPSSGCGGKGGGGKSGGSGGTGASVNGYVDIDYRSPDHATTSKDWYQLITGNSAISNCNTNCSNGFSSLSNLSQGDVNNEKSGVSLQYLYKGYPDNYMIPAAIKERYIPDVTGKPVINSNYYCESSNIYTVPASNCPYATVAIFSSTGIPPINSSFSGTSFETAYFIGRKIVAMVYDGTYDVASGSGANGVTIVGYVLVQIDGYGSTSPKNLDLNLTPNKLTNKGNALFAHAISDIVEPPAYTGGCYSAFLQSITDLRYMGVTPTLVK